MKIVFLDKRKQLARIREPGLAYELLPVEKGPSDRFRRHYGSHRLIRVSAEVRTSDQLFAFVKQPVVMNGRVLIHLHFF